MEKALISIIVPIYNTERYLSDCLESLQKQSYPHIEILLINDGSTDTSAEICKRFCDTDERFVFIEQENQGLGRTRNIGVRKASGEYICMVDSDDVVHPRYVEILYNNLIECGADISIGNYVKFSGKLPIITEVGNKPVELRTKELICDISTAGPGNRSEKIVVCWNKLVRKELWDGIFFPHKLHEDEFVILDLLLRSKKVVYTGDILYFYRQRPESIMGNLNCTDMAHLSLLEAIQSRIQKLSGAEYKDVFSSVLFSYFDNAIILYFGLSECLDGKIVKRRIFPKYTRILLKYMHRISIKKLLRYGMFLFIPNVYRQRYWQ